MVEPIDKNEEFDLTDYYSYPKRFKSKFEPYLPHLSMLIKFIYWNERLYSQLITKNNLFRFAF